LVHPNETPLRIDGCACSSCLGPARNPGAGRETDVGGRSASRCLTERGENQKRKNKNQKKQEFREMPGGAGFGEQDAVRDAPPTTSRPRAEKEKKGANGGKRNPVAAAYKWTRSRAPFFSFRTTNNNQQQSSTTRHNT